MYLQCEAQPIHYTILSYLKSQIENAMTFLIFFCILDLLVLL